MSRRKNSKNRLPNQGLREPCYFFPEDLQLPEDVSAFDMSDMSF